MATICRYLQESADRHARELDVSVESLLLKGLTWVLSRLHVSLLTYPAWRETIRIETWPSGRSDHTALRDFIIVNATGDPVGHATSCWMVLDIRKRRSILLPDCIRALPLPDRPRAINDSFERLPTVTTVEREVMRTAGWKEIDVNRHVNNVTYVEWALDSVHDEMWLTHRPHQLEIAFKNEIRHGDMVASQLQSIPNDLNHDTTFLHSLTRPDLEVASVRTRWQPIRKC